MFSKAVEWKLIVDSPRFRLLKAYGRDTKISPDTERILLNNLSEPIPNKRNAKPDPRRAGDRAGYRNETF